ncbi:MAG TPA: lytic transglycosylase domain-containing protein, partial [Pseudolabrys sp.]|nr:lytic transglycosylase domain-containing protein [Pseudolabrys sp.]
MAGWFVSRRMQRIVCVAAAVLSLAAGAPSAADEDRDSRVSLCLLIDSAASANSLPAEFLTRVIWRESRFKPLAVGPATGGGARAEGIAQFMPGTAAERALADPFDPVEALPKAAAFLRDLRDDFGNLGLAAAAYNAGPQRVRGWLAGTRSMPDETRHYVRAITGRGVEEWARGAVADEAGHRPDQKNCTQTLAALNAPPAAFALELERRVDVAIGKPWGV